MKTKALYIVLICIVLWGCSKQHKSSQELEMPKDSLSYWITASKNSQLPLPERRQSLKKAYIYSRSQLTDSVTARTLSEIAYRYLTVQDTIKFKKINEEAYQLAIKLKDTYALADIHWNKGLVYKNLQVYDSAYYHYNNAYTLFEAINEQKNTVRMLYGMAFMRGRYRDYAGSEELIIKAITKSKQLEDYELLHICYNHLGNLYDDMKDYDQALFYQNKAYRYLDKVDRDIRLNLEETSFNNLGLIYMKIGNYTKALEYYNRILNKEDLKKRNPAHYARVLDNRAYCKLLKGDTMGIIQDFYTALYIRDSMNNKAGIVINKMHLSEYHIYKQDSVRALVFAKEANELAGDIKNGRDYLASLKLLARLDKQEANYYLNRHITYEDNLQGIERENLNRFARVAFETDEYIAKNKRLSEQKVKIVIISLGVLLVLSLLYYIRIQLIRNEKLRLETEQQKANEQLYILRLRQHTKLEEEKTKERKRISEELHDGVLGNLFGARVGLGFLEVKGTTDTLKQYHSFLEELQNIEKEIREVSHKLHVNESNNNFNFNNLLGKLAHDKSKLGNFTCLLTIDETIDWKEIDELVKVNLYRIFQEALQNIVKYAKALNVWLNLNEMGNNLEVCVKDDGVGFNTKKNKKGIGIENMQSRVKKLNGSFEIYSKPCKGTSIRLYIPKHIKEA